ncbi:polyhydroxybutyrate depolymerase [Mycolicibacterium brisbanense]|uniref:extracellular catalytic domain type 1 short-chain-length polyhydroxyalkanoate depolymerase n=1 Tax=Mycolicibacterium brisbanense TaxID=146020 RepID=UPI0021F26B82|nr:PHB depolymerase family esterase [Mycolicibacterium brisbanense]MCV7158925.1 polyhydroxybutyrate depolymerase [Mycolicibacterium brisbanense]
MIARCGWLLVVVLVSACSGPGHPALPGVPDGQSVRHINVGGLDRIYRLYRPEGLPASAALVVMLHGGFGSAAQAERSYGWDSLADSAKFVVAYPDGVSRAWNVGGCCGQPAKENIDDVGFINAVVADVRAGIGIDPRRVYATGMSNGGMMAFALACNSGTFAAIGPVSATQLSCPNPRPISVMHIHGTADPMIRYDGGEGIGFARINGPPVLDVDASWRKVDQCGPPTVTTNGGVSTSTATCPDNRAVVLSTVEGGGHDWPPFATTALWQFFAAHAR